MLNMNCQANFQKLYQVCWCEILSMIFDRYQYYKWWLPASNGTGIKRICHKILFGLFCFWRTSLKSLTYAKDPIICQQWGTNDCIVVLNVVQGCYIKGKGWGKIPYFLLPITVVVRYWYTTVLDFCLIYASWTVDINIFTQRSWPKQRNLSYLW